MNDLISRQNTADVMERWLYDGEDKRTVREVVYELSSVEPERKKGKWIKFNNSCTIRCNQCGQEMTSLCDIQLPNYCPNCGSKIEE